MKKIIIAACAIALASVVQAAAVGWSCAGLTTAKGNAYDFFVIGQNGVTSVAQITALVAAGSDVSSYAFGSGSVNTSGAANVATTASGKTLDAGTSYTGFFVVFNDDTIADATQYLAITSEQSSTLVQSPKSTAGSFTFVGGNQATYAGNASNWKAIPEPTSGLLLLIGMAGLALRRRRA